MGRILASIGFLIAVALVYLALSTGQGSNNAPTFLLSPSDTTSTPIQYVGSSTTEEKLNDSGGTPCVSNCGDRAEGFDRAKRKEIGKEADCDEDGQSHNSPSITHGCRDYVKKNTR